MSQLPQELENSPLFKLLCDQQLITSYIHAKLELLNYWKGGYDSNAPVLVNNRYLIFSAHVYYRSLVIDFCALFGSGHSDKRSFFKLRTFYDSIPGPIQAQVDKILLPYSDKEGPFEQIRIQRNQQIAHYDLEALKSLSFKLEHLEFFNTMYSDATSIISLVGKTFVPSVGFDFRMLSKLDSFVRLVDDAAKGKSR